MYDCGHGSSKSHCGTPLQQLKNAIHRRNVKNEPKDGFSGCEDLLTLIVTCHILCAALELFNMNDLDSEPCFELIPTNINHKNKDSKQQILYV